MIPLRVDLSRLHSAIEAAIAEARLGAIGAYMNGAAPHLVPLFWGWPGLAIVGTVDERVQLHRADPAGIAESWRAALGLLPFVPAAAPGLMAAEGRTRVGMVRITYVTDRDAYDAHCGDRHPESIPAV